MRATSLACVALLASLTSGCRPDLESGRFRIITAPFETSFATDGRNAVATDFQEMKVAIEIDLKAKKATGLAKLELKATETGHPYFLLDAAAVLGAELDGAPIQLEQVTDPDKLNTFWLVPRELQAGTSHQLEVEYELKPERVTFGEKGAAFVTSMSDLKTGSYLERYAPANYEFDQFRMTLNTRIVGASATHKAFSNGSLAQKGKYEWEAAFPARFTSSSFYFHVTDKKVTVIKSKYEGLEKDIPITVYSETEADAKTATEKLQEYFKELEGTYGPYLHDSFVALIIPGKGGMEYCGASITSLKALAHELTHSWFARGVMPGYGSAGWIDEAIASWRDYGYQRSASILDRVPTMLADFPAYERWTPKNSYVDGRALLADLDFVFSATPYGGLKPVLAELFALRKGTTITTQFFQKFLEERAQVSLGYFFDRYVFSTGLHFDLPRSKSIGPEADEESLHPLPLTDEEVRSIR